MMPLKAILFNRTLNTGTVKPVYIILQCAVAMCFIGHGAFGIITKPIWCNYFAVVGIGEVMAYKLMPVVGTIDILMGISILVYPTRAITLWLVIWGLITASMRPLSGEPIAEMIERAGNYGAPLALLLLCGFEPSVKSLFSKMKQPVSVSIDRLKMVQLALRIAAFLLLTGHGWLNLLHKKGLIAQYNALGFRQAENVALVNGVVEIVAALFILLRPNRRLLLVFFIWKVATELLYPQYAAFEWIERGGSYGVLLALWFICAPHAKPVHGAQKTVIISG
ncbi:hypothetical protein LJ707_05010 [Mucilaginibacter sp. UR6-1]|uniref:hypothetical protein n=1 Tax=Mucilaginibacter sp. UR6-1 TaxID=1435643 RepID=UPI001E41CCDE|nr:hypothetical protein [Mucilaginibacter sp. UR6-1]MCC8408279.1 hypothetical protein [Mucilaginibacter sp. UR6-1]